MEYHGLQLDPFQIDAIEAINRNESVIVSAPTGTGKTLVADYLAEKMLKQGQKIVYTAPIKALSNQKFKDFSRQFGAEQVGIMTGDVVMNPEGRLLLMTTEVFRNQVITNDPNLQEVAYVIFDEIHWLNDEERGTVWEESIILSPLHIKILGLSATIANAAELVRWIEDVRQDKVTLIEQHKRVVPLTYAYYSKETGFLDYPKLMAYYQTKKEAAQRKEELPFFEPTTHVDLVQSIEKKYLPCLFFVFSRRQCGEKAHDLASARNYLAPEQSEKVLTAFENQFGPQDTWSSSTRNLFRVCRRGIGYHHAGLLPLQKSLVEDLFFQKLILVMYCTETFSVGINYPVRAVCFDALYKYDGHHFRPLANHEFFQMSGRAGRRGLDEQGFSFALVDLNYIEKEPPLQFDIKKLEPLSSQFKLSYNTVLNLLATLTEAQILTFFQKSFASYSHSVMERETGGKLEQARAERRELRKQVCHRLRTFSCPLQYYPKQKELARMQKAYKKFNAKQRRKIYARQLFRRIQKWEKLLSSTPQACDEQQCQICRSASQKLQPLEEKITLLEQRLANLPDHLFFQNEFQRKKTHLETLGYIENDLLLPRGQLARYIYVQELFVTEFLFSALPDDLNDNLLCGLLSCVDYEMRRNDFFVKPDLLHLPPIKEIIQLIQSVCGPDTVRFDPRVAALAYSWSQGASFTEIQKMCNLDEGDIISLFRRTIDLLRQIKDAVSDPLLRERIRSCMKLMDRDEAAVAEL